MGSQKHTMHTHSYPDVIYLSQSTSQNVLVGERKAEESGDTENVKKLRLCNCKVLLNNVLLGHLRRKIIMKGSIIIFMMIQRNQIEVYLDDERV